MSAPFLRIEAKEALRMVDSLKLRDMISLAEFEKSGQKDMKIFGTGLWNYVLFAMIRTFILTAFALGLLAGLFVFLYFDAVMEYITVNDIIPIGINAVGGFLGIEAVWILIAAVLAAKRFSEAKLKVERYADTVAELLDYTEIINEREEDPEPDEDRN